MWSNALRDRKKCEVNSDPRSDDTCNGIPCFANTCVTNASATSTAVAESVVGMNTLSFVRQSITTKIAVKPLEAGSCSMKSILIECQGRSGIGNSCNRP